MIYMLLLKRERSAHLAEKQTVFAASILIYQRRILSVDMLPSRDKRSEIYIQKAGALVDTHLMDCFILGLYLTRRISKCSNNSDQKQNSL
jgi:hypothetical protein